MHWIFRLFIAIILIGSSSLSPIQVKDTLYWAHQPNDEQKALSVQNLDWQPITGGTFHAGRTLRPVWLKIPTDSITNENDKLVILWKFFNSVTLSPQLNDPGTAVVKSGMDYAKLEWSMPDSHFPAISLPLDSKQDYLYVRLKSQNSISFPIALMSQAKLDQLNYQASLYIYSFQAFIFFVFLICVYFLTQSNQKTGFLSLIAILFSYGMYMNIRYGNSFSLFWPSQPFLEKNLRELFLCLTAFFCYQFFALFFKEYKQPEWISDGIQLAKKVLSSYLLIHITLLVTLSEDSQYYQDLRRIPNLFLAIMILHASACLVFFLLQEQKKRLSFVLFLFSWFLLLSSTIPNTLYSLGILEYTSIIAYGGGLTLPIDILFYALAYQSQIMEKKSLEIFNAQAEQLKQKKKAAMMDVDFHAMTPAIRRSLLKEKSYLNPQVKLEELAHSTGINRNYLSAYFNQHLKITYPEAINELRVRHIRKQIKSGNTGRLLDLALEAGFDSKATFNRVFKKITGLTPSEYIKTTHPNHKATA